MLHVRVPDARRSRFWFVATPGDVSLCFTDPGFDVDVTLEVAAGRALPGLARCAGAARRRCADGRVTLTGPREVGAPAARRAAAEPGGARTSERARAAAGAM